MPARVAGLARRSGPTARMATTLWVVRSTAAVSQRDDPQLGAARRRRSRAPAPATRASSAAGLERRDQADQQQREDRHADAALEPVDEDARAPSRCPASTRSSCAGREQAQRQRHAPRAASSPASSASTRWRRASSMRDHDQRHQRSSAGRGRSPRGRRRGPPACRRARRRSRSAAAIATAPAGSTYFSRARTVPPMSAPCVPADAIVVSEIGEMLSPNVAPPRIAPSSAPGCAPAPAAGRIEQRPADQDRAEAGAGGRRDDGAGEERRRRRRRRRAGRARGRTTPAPRRSRSRPAAC